MAEDSEGEGPATDLFGEPMVDPKDPRGRPKFHITTQMYEKVQVLSGLGMSKKDIAASIGCSEPTLRNYFFSQLKASAAKVRAEVLVALMDKVREGNVPAMKVALGLADLGDAAVPLSASTSAAPGRVEKLGKKESALVDAQTAHEGTEWGDLLH